jgi:hypothetical protein
VSTQERVELTADEAIAMLPRGEDQHTFEQTGGCIVGFDWSRNKIIEMITQSEIRVLSGSAATNMNHGLAIIRDGGWLFVKTKPQEVNQ